MPDPYKRGPSLKHLLQQDDVECILNTIFKEVGKTCLGVANLIICQGHVEGDIQDPGEFKLTLHIRVPPTTCFLMDQDWTRTRGIYCKYVIVT